MAGAALAAQGRLAVVRPDELTPAVMRLLGPWAVLLAGIAVLAALMSTTASFLNLAAAALTRDLPAALGRAAGSVTAGRAATVVIGAAAVVLGVQSERTVALLGVAGWGFFTAALLPVFAIGLAWPRARGVAVAAAIVAGAAVDLALEAVRSQLPPGLEPGLAGAAVGTLVLVAMSVAGTTCRTREGKLTADSSQLSPSQPTQHGHHPPVPSTPTSRPSGGRRSLFAGWGTAEAVGCRLSAPLPGTRTPGP